MVYTFGNIRPDTIAEKLWRVHWPLLIVACGVAAIGAAALYSVAGGSFQPWAERHALRFLIGIAIVIAMALVRLEVWLRAAFPVYALALIMLALVPFIGIDALGARRWIGFSGITFQPSELMKLALVAAIARYYQWLPDGRLSKPLWVAIPVAMIAIPVVLTLKQPDLGSALLFAALGLGLMFLAGVSVFYFAGGIIATLAALPLVWDHLHDYQRRRVEIFLNPEKDPLGAGYHITQSKIALGSGGVAGKGFMQGTQSQLDFVPEKHTDFIFTLLGEEWGFAGLLVVLSLYMLMLILMFSMAWRCENLFARLLIAGTALTLFVYVFINVAMVTGLVPVVGIPLPLISYGGTSMMTLMIAIGLAMSGFVHGKDTFRRNELGRFW